MYQRILVLLFIFSFLTISVKMMSTSKDIEQKEETENVNYYEMNEDEDSLFKEAIFFILPKLVAATEKKAMAAVDTNFKITAKYFEIHSPPPEHSLLG